MKSILFEFERGGEVIADLLEEEAPKTCKAVLEALPIEHKFIHATLAGAEIYFDGLPFTLGFENETIDVKSGDVVCVPSEAIPRLAAEGISALCIFYGRGRPMKDIDEPVKANLFARIRDIETIAEIGRKIRLEGPGKMSIKREA